MEHGDSSGDTFWIKYPEPFLEYYYDTYPDKLPKANDQTPAAASPVPTVAAEQSDAAGAAATNMEAETPPTAIAPSVLRILIKA